MKRGSSIWNNRILGHAELSPGELVAHPLNWRVHTKSQRAALQALIERVGWVGQVTVNRRTGHLVDGHLRAAVAAARGEARVPVTYVDLNESDELLVLATLDPLSAMAASNEAGLQQLLALIDEPDEQIRDLLDLVARAAERAERPLHEADLDDVVVQAGEPVSRRGDLGVRGRHRRFCGDATEVADVQQITGGRPDELALADPPYGVSYTGRTAAALTMSNDDAAQLGAPLASAFECQRREPRAGRCVMCPGGGVGTCPGFPDWGGLEIMPHQRLVRAAARTRQD